MPVHISFRPRLLPTIATLVMISVMCGLGQWQLQRLDWKLRLISSIDQRINEPPLDISKFRGADEANYHPATATGVFLNDYVFYLLALSKTGEGGYHVLTPFKLDDGMMLLVDRGWIPYDRRDNFSKIEGKTQITGVMRLPEHHLFVSSNDIAKNNWYQIDVNAMGQAANGLLMPYYLEADATPNPGGFPIGGQTRLTLPNNHFGYALTWFGMAFVLAFIYLLSSFQKRAAN